MLSIKKSLVVAALLAATHAEGEEAAAADGAAADGGADGAAADGAADGAAADGAADGAAADDGAADKDGAADGAADGDAADGAADGDKADGDKADGGDGAAADGDDKAADGEGSDGLPEEKRDAWKDVDGAVLCDQGDDALWEDAERRLKRLKADHDDVKAVLATAKGEYDPLKQTADDMVAAALKHTTDNAAFLADYTTAKDKVDDLTAAAGGTDATGTKQTALDGVVADTTAAVTAVQTQGARVEALIEAQTTQVASEAAWGERATAANTAKLAADDAEDVADAALLEAQEQVSKRSWLFTVLGQIDSSQWAADCEALLGATQNAKCALSESAYTATTSTWSWNTDDRCDYSVTAGVTVTNYTCQMLGLKGASLGLIQSATTMVGTARVTTSGSEAAPTGLYAALETEDYTYAASGATTALADALTAYETLQKKALLAEALKVACWKDKTGANFVSGDAYAWCNYKDGTFTGVERFHPLLQGSATSTTQVYAATEATTAAANFDGTGTGTDKHVTQTKQDARARAQANLWYGDWLLAALNTNFNAVGDESTKAGNAGWSTTTIGAAEATQTTKVALAVAANEELKAATRWQAIAGEEVTAAGNDLTRARALLVDLTDAIAPLARMEITARNDLAAAVADEAARALAEEELGTVYVAAVGATPEQPATGARAVRDAALVAKESIDAQQEFHDARSAWAADNLAPVATIYNALVAEEAGLQGQIDLAVERLDGAREQCKRAAFEFAQDAREKAQEAAAAKADKVAEVKKAYDAVAAFPTDGSAGTLCHYPKVAADAAPTPRTECLEGEPGAPLCCGAAQRFLKDGTKLSIETCQLATSTTYTYYPALPTGALVAPTAETWRFQCVSAAQKLAAATAALLAAGYMMA